MSPEITTSNIKMVHGIRLIRLVGSSDERATQHGRILAALSAEERAQLALNPLSTKNQSLIRRASGKARAFSPIVEKFYEAFVLRQFTKLPKEYKRRLRPFVKASRFSERVLWLSLFQPDLLMMLAGMANEHMQQYFLTGLPGCTSGILENNGESLFLRNLDYPAAGFWEKWPTIFYHEPTEAGSQKYISMSSLGIHTPGLTGWNESGIAFSLHAHFSKKNSMTGIPIFFLGEDILEKARSFEDAIQICKRFKTIGSWAINLASFKENRFATLELNDGKISVNLAEKTGDHQTILSHANGFFTPEFKKNEIYFSGSFLEDVRSRKATMKELLSSLDSHPKIEDALNALSSHFDHETKETRAFGNNISVVTTIQSILMDSAHQCVYLSSRLESPTGLGPFVKIPVDWNQVSEAVANPELIYPSYRYTEKFYAAVHAYHQAYAEWQVKGQGTAAAAELALAFLIQATDEDPADPHVWMQRGYFELLHHQFKPAQECFATALKYKMSPHHTNVCRYFLAACQDLLNSREMALQIYQELYGLPKLDPKLKKKVARRLEKPFTRSYCQKIEPDLQFVEPLNYN